MIQGVPNKVFSQCNIEQLQTYFLRGFSNAYSMAKMRVNVGEQENVHISKGEQ